MLAMGFVLSLILVGSLGSFVAMLIGVRALTSINRSPVRLAGKVMAWWRIICGGIVFILILPYTIFMIINPSE